MNFLYKIYKTIHNKNFMKTDAVHVEKPKKYEICNYDKLFGLLCSHTMTSLTNIKWILKYIDNR